MKSNELQMDKERKKKRLKTVESINLENEEEKMNEIQYFDSVPKDLEIIILSFVISETKESWEGYFWNNIKSGSSIIYDAKKDWKKEWNNISLVSKHWNSIAWISFQRTIPKNEREELFSLGCKKEWFHFINKFLIQDTTFDPSFQDNATIMEACRCGRSAILKLLLLDNRVDPSANNNYAIIKASSYEFVDIVKLLLQDDRVNPSDENNAAVRDACRYGRFDTVKLLLQDERVNPSDYKNEAIINASKNGFIGIVKILLQDKRVDPSARHNSALRIAEAKGREDILKLLLQDKRVVLCDSLFKVTV